MKTIKFKTESGVEMEMTKQDSFSFFVALMKKMVEEGLRCCFSDAPLSDGLTRALVDEAGLDMTDTSRDEWEGYVEALAWRALCEGVLGFASYGTPEWLRKKGYEDDFIAIAEEFRARADEMKGLLRGFRKSEELVPEGIFDGVWEVES